MLEESSVDRELARRLCAAFVSEQMGVTVATHTRKRRKTWAICGISLPP